MEQEENNFVQYPCEITGPAYSDEVGNAKNIYPIKILDSSIPKRKKKNKKYKKLVKRIEELEARVEKLEAIANTTSVFVPYTCTDKDSIITTTTTPGGKDPWITITNN